MAPLRNPFLRRGQFFVHPQARSIEAAHRLLIDKADAMQALHGLMHGSGDVATILGVSGHCLVA
jgi:hypothetical protein